MIAARQDFVWSFPDGLPRITGVLKHGGTSRKQDSNQRGFRTRTDARKVISINLTGSAHQRCP